MKQDNYCTQHDILDCVECDGAEVVAGHCNECFQRCFVIVKANREVTCPICGEDGLVDEQG